MRVIKDAFTRTRMVGACKPGRDALHLFHFTFCCPGRLPPPTDLPLSIVRSVAIRYCPPRDRGTSRRGPTTGLTYSGLGPDGGRQVSPIRACRPPPYVLIWEGGPSVRLSPVTPMPPAVQTEISPRPPPRWASCLARVAMMRAPVAANGWPIATLPPLRFILLRSMLPRGALRPSRSRQNSG